MSTSRAGMVRRALLTVVLLALLASGCATPATAPDADAAAVDPRAVTATQPGEPAPQPPQTIPDAAEAPAAPDPTPPEPTRVVAPRIGVDNLLVGVGLHPDHTLVVPDDAAVAGWYTGAPRPGETGPAVIAGHNAWSGAQGVFARLHELVSGDLVEVHHDDGSVVRFVVERVEQHPKDAFPSERVYGNTPRQEVRVITCGGAFDAHAGAHVDNIIVFGARIS